MPDAESETAISRSDLYYAGGIILGAVGVYAGTTVGFPSLPVVVTIVAAALVFLGIEAIRGDGHGESTNQQVNMSEDND